MQIYLLKIHYGYFDILINIHNECCPYQILAECVEFITAPLNDAGMLFLSTANFY